MDPGATFRLVIAEDHAALRDDLRTALGAEPAYEVVGETGSGPEAARLVAALHPDLVILDPFLTHADGVATLKAIKRARPRTRILVLTAHKREAWVMEAIQGGADGYLLAGGDRAELLNAVACVLRGDFFLSSAVTDSVVAAFLRSRRTPKGAKAYEGLSPREQEVLKLVAEGHRTRDIACHLHISPKTVEKHRGSLMKHLGLHTVSALTAYAISKGLTSTH